MGSAFLLVMCAPMLLAQLLHLTAVKNEVTVIRYGASRSMKTAVCDILKIRGVTLRLHRESKGLAQLLQMTRKRL
jgi:hypothetical protein